jgi:hypothetical protein
VSLGALAILDDPAQVSNHFWAELRFLGLQLFFGEEPSLDALRELYLKLGVEEGDLTDLL